jgi:hypothetical protein
MILAQDRLYGSDLFPRNYRCNRCAYFVNRFISQMDKRLSIASINIHVYISCVAIGTKHVSSMNTQ